MKFNVQHYAVFHFKITSKYNMRNDFIYFPPVVFHSKITSRYNIKELFHTLPNVVFHSKITSRYNLIAITK